MGMDIPFSAIRASPSVREMLEGTLTLPGEGSPFHWAPSVSARVTPQAALCVPARVAVVAVAGRAPLCLAQWGPVAGCGLCLSPEQLQPQPLRQPPPPSALPSFLPPFVTVSVGAASREQPLALCSAAARGGVSCIFQPATHHHPAFPSAAPFQMILPPEARLLNPQAQPQLAQPGASQGLWFWGVGGGWRRAFGEMACFFGRVAE